MEGKNLSMYDVTKLSISFACVNLNPFLPGASYNENDATTLPLPASVCDFCETLDDATIQK